jgi:S-formylglutathione hydrolase
MLELLNEHACHGGRQRYYRHASETIGLPMKFAVYLPPQAEHGKVPAVFYLAGLTCNEDTAVIKAGMQGLAAQLGLAIITPDTSPRNAGVPGETDAWDFGVAAGFYIDASRAPWSTHYRMETYVAQELFALVTRELPIDDKRISIMGHSMGGHGALTLAFKYPGQYRSVSAFAPICNPVNCAWGQKAFAGYLGEDQSQWHHHDACSLIRKRGMGLFNNILVDQGLGDKFLHEAQLHPDALEAACAAAGQSLTLRRHADYDHGYFFIQTFMPDHLQFHAEALR